MMAGFLSFIGGTAFRWLFGEMIGFFKAREENRIELERIRLEHEHAKERAEWQRQAVADAAAQGIKVVEAQSEAYAARAADDAFLSAIGGVNEASKRADWIGAFNALIRPELAQVSIILLVCHAFWPDAVVITGIVGEVICGALGLFIGERISKK
jgi:putative Ca2+/H+ antiporter (TMEM165/GDT1 family)